MATKRRDTAVSCSRSVAHGTSYGITGGTAWGAAGARTLHPISTHTSENGNRAARYDQLDADLLRLDARFSTLGLYDLITLKRQIDLSFHQHLSALIAKL